jgi:hypothetical protein
MCKFYLLNVRHVNKFIIYTQKLNLFQRKQFSKIVCYASLPFTTRGSPPEVFLSTLTVNNFHESRKIPKFTVIRVTVQIEISIVSNVVTINVVNVINVINNDTGVCLKLNL